MKKLAMVLLVSVLAAFGAACTEKTTNNYDKLPTQATVVVLEGQCRVDVSRIVCEDRTTTIPTGQLERVSFTLRSATTGIAIETRSVDAAATPPRQTSFVGVASGRYEVTHEAISKDGNRTSVLYGNLVVSGA